MVELTYFNGVKGMNVFTRGELLQSFRDGGYNLSDISFYKMLTEMVKSGDIVRVSNNTYSLPKGNAKPYQYEYSPLACEVAGVIQEEYPLCEFSIMELVQLNAFVNHQIAHNVLFLSVEAELMDFVFDLLKEQYPGKVLIHPTPEIYHQYWSDNMIVIGKLKTEAPKGQTVHWHTRLEKLLVDIVCEPLLTAAVSSGELPQIYEDAFSLNVVDESCMFRYAKRRNADKKIKKLIQEKTTITLRTKR